MHGSSSTSSRRGVLAPLQADLLARLSAALPDFFLTGGSALAEFYLGHRVSEDLDLFTARIDAFADADVLVRQVAVERGIPVAVVRSSRFFRRYVFDSAEEQVVIDLVLDPVPQVNPDKPIFDGIRTDTLREIAVNKVCTLLERWEPRDLVDLLFIERAGIDPLDLIAEARRKDGGLTPASLAFSLATAPPIDQMPHGMLAPLTVDELRAYRDRLIQRLTILAVPSD
jgi:hypothetical protein